MFSTKEEQDQFDSWTKEEVYQAYISEHFARVNLNKQLNKERLKYKTLKYSIEQSLKA